MAVIDQIEMQVELLVFFRLLLTAQRQFPVHRTDEDKLNGFVDVLAVLACVHHPVEHHQVVAGLQKRW